jgi:hypothetical protein
LASRAVPVLPANGQAGWNRADLVRRVVRQLKFARDATKTVLQEPRLAEMGLPREKFVAETALLLYCVAPIAVMDRRIASSIEEIALDILPLARSDEIRAAICLDPGQALDYAFAHILLGVIGYRDAAMDALLAESLKVEAAPERLPHRLLEQAWLSGLCGRGSSVMQGSVMPWGGTMLARPVDALRATRFDHYGFTHAVMYASDFGAAPPELVSIATADASAVAALAFALKAIDHDLAAEVLLTWPMLRLPWPPAAAFAFDWLTRAEEQRGFLTGISFDSARHDLLSGHEQHCYEIVSCYHTVYVMAFLCAAILRYDRPPPQPDFPADSGWFCTGGQSCDPARQLAELLDRGQREAMGPILLTIALREAVENCQLPSLCAALEIALDFGLTDVLAARQAAALLRRLALLEVEPEGIR